MEALSDKPCNLVIGEAPQYLDWSCRSPSTEIVQPSQNFEEISG